MTRRRSPSIAASPTLVGAVTVLIITVAVFLAYNANQGLPFVPTYQVSAIVPNGARLVNNNEVRIGGFRVGIVETIEPVRNQRTGEYNAKLNLKLNTDVDPLPKDTRVAIRYRSAFGLKYVALTRGKGAPLLEGSTLPISQASNRVEFDDIYSTFDAPTRRNARINLAAGGDALAARGASLNQAIENLNPLLRHLRPVARTLIDPDTKLSNFFRQLGNAARIVAPAAETQAELFTNMAITFAAFSADTKALKQTISKSPPTLDVGISSLRVQRPFLANFADLSARLRPAVAELPGTLPTLNDAFEIGTDAIKRTPPVNRELGRVFTSLDRLVRLPTTEVSLTRLADLLRDLRPGLSFVAPFQTVCNYFNYWFTYLPEHLSAQDQYGFIQRVALAPSVPSAEEQEGSIGSHDKALTASARNRLTGDFEPDELAIAHGNPYGPAVDANGNADCQSGQNGYVLGNLPAPGQSPKLAVVGVSNLPGNRGPTYAGRARLP